jgi:hypothetical protein
MAAAVSAQLLTAELDNGRIKSAIGEARTAMATQYGTMAQYIQNLQSTYKDKFTKLEGTASVVDVMQTFVGMDNNGNKLGTGLVADVEILQKQTDGKV